MRRRGAAGPGGRLLLFLLPRGALLLLGAVATDAEQSRFEELRAGVLQLVRDAADSISQLFVSTSKYECWYCPGVCNAFSLEIKASPKVRAFVGEEVLLKCSFKSSSPITESLLVDWTYRPLSGGQMETVFHYQSIPHPTTVGRFKDRISWVGNVANGDASIIIQSPVLSDNGTFICSVKNPPDVYHNIPQTVLVVTERGLTFQLTSAALLSILVFLPSVLVVILLLVRMGRKFRALKEKGKCGYKKSSIEVSDEPEHTDTAGCGGKIKEWCLNCVDTDEEDPY